MGRPIAIPKFEGLDALVALLGDPKKFKEHLAELNAVHEKIQESLDTLETKKELTRQLDRAKAEREKFTFNQDVWEQARDADAAQLAALNKDLLAEKKRLDAAEAKLNEERAEVAQSRVTFEADMTAARITLDAGMVTLAKGEVKLFEAREVLEAREEAMTARLEKVQAAWS